MKVLRFALVGICFSTSLVFAQENKPNPEVKANEMATKMAEHLELTDEQKEKVEAIGLEMIQTKQKIKQDESLSDDARKEQLKALHQEFKTEMKEVLTEEQYNKFKEHKKEQKDEWKAKTLEEKAQMKTDKMAEMLELSEEQKEQVYQLNLKVANKIKAIKEREDLSEEKKKEFIRGNKKDFKAVLGTILTEEQMAKFEAMKEERKGSQEMKVDKIEE